MASSEGTTPTTPHPFFRTSSSFKGNARVSRRYSMQKIERKVEASDVVQGKILWLPAKEDLPERAVRRAHGKGAIEEGIYNHPVVVISRPADEGHVVHFHLITSFQGKRLNEIYGKANEFHASRRSWYLPISPTPDHPDAASKKSRKRFPTLDLANSATLRWDSYVNIRHVYKMDWSHLKPYANPNTPEIQTFRFERDSMIQLLAKSRVLTLYEPGLQFQNSRPTPVVSVPRAATSPTPIIDRGATGGGGEQYPQSPMSDAGSSVGSEYSATSALLQSDFSDSKSTRERSPGPPRKVPPDREVVVSPHARQESQEEAATDCGCIGYVIKRLLCRPVIQP